VNNEACNIVSMSSPGGTISEHISSFPSYDLFNHEHFLVQDMPNNQLESGSYTLTTSEPHQLHTRPLPMQRCVSADAYPANVVAESNSSYQTPSLIEDSAPYYSSRSTTPCLVGYESSHSGYPSDMDDEPDVEDDTNEERPYNELLFECLMNAPDHEMPLNDIYQWFRDKTDKGQRNEKAWQCSIRHNLSMNKV